MASDRTAMYRRWRGIFQRPVRGYTNANGAIEKIQGLLEGYAKANEILDKILSVCINISDDGYRVTYKGHPATIRISKEGYSIGVLSASNAEPFRLPAKEPLPALQQWLCTCEKAVPPELPSLPAVPETLGSRRKGDYNRVKTLEASAREKHATYKAHRQSFFHQQRTAHKAVAQKAQELLGEMERKPSDDLNARRLLMTELVEFVMRKVALVGHSMGSRRFHLDTDRRLALIEVEFPDLTSTPICIGQDRKGNPKHSGVREKKKIIQEMLCSSAIYYGHLVAKIGLPDLFDSVAVNVVQSWTDPATGRPSQGVVASLMATREDFANLVITQVEPLACFRSLKGIAIPNVEAPSPIRPIMQMDRDDPRFVSSKDIGLDIQAEENLAAMDWEDFEHLIAQVMQWEFAANGVEVKVTRASRDRGVDAIMFDPDPLRGGKYVLQAKRYTRTVDVSAVRDLYGTVMNEGANRGILITTASFGPDSYEFAKDKPLSLVDGANLLNILKRHGKSFRIDLEEARQLSGSL